MGDTGWGGGNRERESVPGLAAGRLPSRWGLPRLGFPMPVSARRFARFFLNASLLIVAAMAGPGTSAAAPVRVLAADARGVTLQVSVGAWGLSVPDRDGRVTVTGLPESHSMSFPGRPLLPAYSAMLALPPDARPTARAGSRGCASGHRG